MVERTMAFKHYDVVRAASPSDLAEKLTHKLKEGWQPFGSPVAITPYTLMQAIAAEGDVVVSGATEPGGTTSSYWPGNPMPWLTVKGFRFRIHTMRPIRALSNWPVVTQ